MIFLIITGIGLAYGLFVSTAIVTPIFLFCQLLSARPGKWWYVGISFVVGFLVFFNLFSTGGAARDTGFEIFVAFVLGTLTSTFGVFWHWIVVRGIGADKRSSVEELDSGPDETEPMASDGFSRGWVLTILGILIAQTVFIIVITS